ncbi:MULTISPECIES: cytochrome P460 family protein [Methylomonas]|jgi:Cytochrome P460|nr:MULTISPECIES: cytochrome P460 family protein [Methylomonas]
MRRNIKARYLMVVTAVLPLIGMSLTHAEGNTANASAHFSPYVDETGRITLPTDFRRTMVHLGSWHVPEGDASGFHDVYADGKAVDEFRKTGKFPDGAAIVKELRASTAGNYTTGTGVSYANNTIKQWFVMIKDRQGRFPKNTSWGDGWGWALVKNDGTNINVSANYKKDCISCHTPVKDKDWIYVEGYPTLFPKK